MVHDVKKMVYGSGTALKAYLEISYKLGMPFYYSFWKFIEILLTNWRHNVLPLYMWTLEVQNNTDAHTYIHIYAIHNLGWWTHWSIPQTSQPAKNESSDPREPTQRGTETGRGLDRADRFHVPRQSRHAPIKPIDPRACPTPRDSAIFRCR
jgi:hypothetical protein